MRPGFPSGVPIWLLLSLQSMTLWLHDPSRRGFPVGLANKFILRVSPPNPTMIPSHQPTSPPDPDPDPDPDPRLCPCGSLRTFFHRTTDDEDDIEKVKVGRNVL